MPGQILAFTAALQQAAAIGGAGFVGAMARYYVGHICTWLFGTGFPVGTTVINLSGSFFLGWFMTFITYRATVSDTTRLAIAVGFTGAYTTFSTLMYEANKQLDAHEYAKAAINLVGSLVLGILAVRLGIWTAGGHDLAK